MGVEHRIPVGVLVDRKQAASPWIDYLWVPAAVVTGWPEAVPMTLVAKSGADERYFAGATHLVLASSETAHYRDNLVSGTPKLWVVIRVSEVDGSVTLCAVTADPSEGEGFAESGANLVEPVAMPPEIAAEIAAFVDEHHVEREFYKRKRERVDPEALGFRRPREGERG